MALYASKTSKVWIPSNLSMFYSGYFRYWVIFFFLLLLSFALFDRFFSTILFWFTIGCFPFYSVILGFRGTTDSLPLLPWVPEPMLCQQLWWLVPSLFLIIFFFWCFFPKSLLSTFHFRVSLESWPLISLPLRVLHLTFSDSAFFPFCHFSLVSRFPLCQVESFPNHFPSWFFFLSSLKYQPFIH